MLKSIANSSTGLRAHQQMLDVTAQNLANVNTIAYKERLVSFQELLYRDLAERRLPVAGGAGFVQGCFITGRNRFPNLRFKQWRTGG